MTAPERIWAIDAHPKDPIDNVIADLVPHPGLEEYILASHVADMIRQAVEAEREACAKVADEYAEENFRMANDTIMIDPILTAHRKNRPYIRTAQTDELSEKCQIDGAMHSSSAHTAQHVAAAIRRRG